MPIWPHFWTSQKCIVLDPPPLLPNGILCMSCIYHSTVIETFLSPIGGVPGWQNWWEAGGMFRYRLQPCQEARNVQILQVASQERTVEKMADRVGQVNDGDNFHNNCRIKVARSLFYDHHQNHVGVVIKEGWSSTRDFTIFYNICDPKHSYRSTYSNAQQCRPHRKWL